MNRSKSIHQWFSVSYSYVPQLLVNSTSKLAVIVCIISIVTRLRFNKDLDLIIIRVGIIYAYIYLV